MMEWYRRHAHHHHLRWVVLLLLGVLVFTTLLYILLSFLEGFLQTSFPKAAFLAYVMVFVVTFVSSALVAVPAPSPLIALSFAIAVAAKFEPVWVIFAASIGSTLGETSSYLVGRWGSKTIVDGANSRLPLWARGWMQRSTSVVVFVLAFIPSFLFDFAGIAAGALRLPYWQFLLVVWAARLPRSAIEIYYGGKIIDFFLTLFR